VVIATSMKGKIQQRVAFAQGCARLHPRYDHAPLQDRRLMVAAPRFARLFRPHSAKANLTVTGERPLLTTTSAISDEHRIVAMGTRCKCVSQY
jgi:hypothetical protein